MYCTDGILLSQLLTGDILLQDYDVIIIDEVHERPVPIDLLLYFVRNILNKRPEFKLILMSATVSTELFANYFKDFSFVEQTIQGQSYYPITSIWSKEQITERNYLQKGINIILDIIHDVNKKGDILFFVSTTNEVIQGCKMLHDICNLRRSSLPADVQIKTTNMCDTFYCIEVYGKMSDDMKKLALSTDEYKQLSNKYTRKVLISTNVAESSITFEGIIYVIESGYEWSVTNDSSRQAAIMSKKFISKAQIRQRMGRSGRTQPGICYHLYTESQFNNAPDYPSPLILVNDLTDHMINFIKYQKVLKHTYTLLENLITIPNINQIIGSIYFLHFYDMIKIIKSKNIFDSDSVNTPQEPTYKLIKGGSLVDLNDSTDDLPNYDQTTDDSRNELSVEESTNDLSVDESTDKSSTEEITDEITNYNESTVSSTDEVSPNNELVNRKLTIDELMDDYLNCQSIDDFKKYNGSLTKFGYLISKMSGFPILVSIMILYGILLNITNIILDLASVLIISEYKIDNLVNDDSFIDKYIYEASEHITMYQIYVDYYLSGNTIGLNIDNFKKIDDMKETLLKLTNKITVNVLLQINDKYHILSEKIMQSKLETMDKLLLALILSHKINLAYFDEEKIIGFGDKKKLTKFYKNKYPLIKSLGQISFKLKLAEPKTSYNKLPLIYSSNIKINNSNYFSTITIVPHHLLIYL